RFGSARTPIGLVLGGLVGGGAPGEAEGDARPAAASHEPEHEGGAEDREAAEDEEKRPRAAVALAPRGHHMLSGALTPSSSRPFRITRPTPAHSASRASINCRSSWMTRWFLYYGWNIPASSCSQYATRCGSSARAAPRTTSGYCKSRLMIASSSSSRSGDRSISPSGGTTSPCSATCLSIDLMRACAYWT